MVAGSAQTQLVPRVSGSAATRVQGTSIELFAGGGGLALGTEQAGFTHLVMNEYDARSCQTLRLNGARDLLLAGNGHRPLIEGDCRAVDWTPWRGQLDLLAGGPPCQPFSIGGVHRGDQDSRNLFPEAIRALDETRPRAFFFENVRGLARASFRPYFEHILDWLKVPHLMPGADEEWNDHHSRLVRQLATEPSSARYDVWWTLVNAADYGVPQQRWRVLIVGFRADLDIDWRFPEATHSRQALLAALHDGRYWTEHGLEQPKAFRSSVRRSVKDAPVERWRTLRDAIQDLPEPVDGVPHPIFVNHDGVPRARLYAGHSGSVLDWPAKAVKAGVHGCPGGEHILVRTDGTYRYWTVRETARVQTFPDDHHFQGPRSEAMRQIGNAVPPRLARLVASAIAERLAHTVHEVGAD